MISVTDPIQWAMDWTKKVLFGPFILEKWLTMGFTAFLASLASGGGSGFNSHNPFKPKGDALVSPMAKVEEALQWAQAHRPLVIGAIAALLLVIVVLQWLRARGIFMFLDNVVNDRGRVAEPWNRYREPANRLFVAFLLLNAAGLALVAGGLYAGWRNVAPDLAGMHFGLHTLKGFLAILAVTAPLGFVLLMTGLVLKDFVVPVMFLRGTTVTEGFGVLWNEVMPGNLGSFALFYLMKFILVLAAAVVIFFGTCITCCIAGLPYVSAVVFLPITVFFRSYSLHFMGQAAEEWRILPMGSQH